MHRKSLIMFILLLSANSLFSKNYTYKITNKTDKIVTVWMLRSGRTYFYQKAQLEGLYLEDIPENWRKAESNAPYAFSKIDPWQTLTITTTKGSCGGGILVKEGEHNWYDWKDVQLLGRRKHICKKWFDIVDGATIGMLRADCYADTGKIRCYDKHWQIKINDKGEYDLQNYKKESEDIELGGVQPGEGKAGSK